MADQAADIATRTSTPSPSLRGRGVWCAPLEFRVRRLQRSTHGPAASRFGTVCLVVTFLLLIAHQAHAQSHSADADGFLNDCRVLTADPHRLTGTDEYERAAAHAERRLREIGLDKVLLQPFATAQTRVVRCDLELAGENDQAPRRIDLMPMRPNAVVPPATGPEGIEGPLYHAGPGRPEDYGQRTPKGCIVVLNYSAGRAWMRAFRMGARAVVFTATETAHASWSHHVEVPANLPRFYYSGPAQDLVDGRRATIHSHVVWEGATGLNVLGLIRGTDPVFDLEKDEMVVVSAHLDSFGQVPRLSPGARAAVNVAALVKVAEHLKENRPRRHVLVAFLDGHARGHAGASALYRAIDRRSGFDDRQESLQNEQRFLSDMSAALASADPLAPGTGVRRELVQRIQGHASRFAAELNEQLYELRGRQQAAGEKSSQHAALDAQVKEAEQAKDRWNDLRRALRRERDTSAVEDELAVALNAIRNDISTRRRELELESRAMDVEVHLREALGGAQVSLHVSLLLGDASPRWGLAVGGHSGFRAPKDLPGLYTRVQTAFLNAHKDLALQNRAPQGFEVASADGMLDPADALWQAPRLVHSGEIAGLLGIYNVVICTTGENTPREGTPHDTLEAMNVPRVEAIVGQIAPLMAATFSQRALSQISSIESRAAYLYPKFSGNRGLGATAVTRMRGSSTQVPLPGVALQLSRRNVSPGFEPKRPYAHDNFNVVMTDQNGSYVHGPHTEGGLWGFGVVTDAQGRVLLASTGTSRNLVRTRMNLIRCRPGAAVLPPQVSVGKLVTMDASSDSRLSDDRSIAGVGDGIAWWYGEEQVSAVKLFGLGTIVALSSDPIASTARRSASDLWDLNESRMAVLRSRAIMNNSIEELHGRAEDMRLDAEQTPAVARSEALAAASFLAEKAVYTRVRSTLDDLVHAVLVLLGLAVPFAFALERLLVGAVNVYKQIGWFAAIFAATFMVLYASHPAFAISNTPAIIFLGFAIVVLSALVIFIIMRKFEVELKVLQGLTTTVHAVDVSRLTTIIAAVAMGISTMRRRPMRTALTAVTILLLTFTILCFASFEAQTGDIQLFIAGAPNHRGVLFHRVNWQPIPQPMLEVFEGRWSEEHRVCPRFWVTPKTVDPSAVLATRDDGSSPVLLSGLLGVPSSELAAREDLRRLLGGVTNLADDTVHITEEVAQRLKVVPGDRVLLAGLPMRVGALLNAAAVGAVREMDGSQILPVDFANLANQETASRPRPQEDTEAVEVSQNWIALPPDAVGIVSATTARELGGWLASVCVYVRHTSDAEALAADMTRMLGMPVSATHADGVYRHLLGTLVNASDLKDLFFPLLLGGMVVFGTMLGSVSDREKEIYSFSALGLAPPHVAGLFLAEAMVYAMIGGLGGYLLAEGSVKGLSALAQFTPLRVPEMNYSSTTAIVTLVIVMAVVLVSAIYPAIRASRSANPGILRSWRMPAPDGDTFDIAFPFTVSQYDFTGIVSFLKEHFDYYMDTGLGVFMAKNTRIEGDGDDELGVGAELALAPFDLGVTQRFELRSEVSEIEGIEVVKIRITRLSGQPRDWQRLNKVLLDDLRRQFLIWRSLPHDTMEIYRQRTLEVMGGTASEEEAPMEMDSRA